MPIPLSRPFCISAIFDTTTPTSKAAEPANNENISIVYLFHYNGFPLHVDSISMELAILYLKG